jgi:hypothetical protein
MLSFMPQPLRAAVLMLLPLAMAAAGPEIRESLGPCEAAYPFGWSEPESQGVSSETLLKLTKWVADDNRHHRGRC